MIIAAAWQVTDKNAGEKAAHRFLDKDPKYERAKPRYGGGREWFIVKKGTLRNVYNGIENNLKEDKVFKKRV